MIFIAAHFEMSPSEIMNRGGIRHDE